MIYVAWIESGYRNDARSPAGAVGMWQFMAGTARGYGLEVSAYVDERRDPVRSSRAAARHLADLHAEFGSWHAAAAAYNAGTGRVGRALRRVTGRASGNDLLFWRARPALPRETRDYVPKLLAAARVAADLRAHALPTAPPVPPLRFRVAVVPGGTRLADVARRTGVDPRTLRDLNPHLIRGMTPPGRRWPVRFPPNPAPAGRP